MRVSGKLRKLNICVLLVLLGTTVTDALGPPFGVGVGAVPKCEPSVTTASGSYVAHKGTEDEPRFNTIQI